MSRQLVVGIDIGSSETRVLIAEGVVEDGHFTPKIIGTGTEESRGVERGFISNIGEASDSLRRAIAKAEKTADTKVKRAYVSFGGIGLGSLTSTGQAIITRADLEVSEKDLQSALEAAEKAIPKGSLTNKTIINTIPIEYKIDGQVSWGSPVGLQATKVEVKALFLTGLEHHIEDLIKTAELAGVEVIDIVAAPVAGSFVTISKKSQRVGTLLADIGSETMSVITFDNNNPVSLEVFPVGGSDITNDIALGLKVSLEEAETIKLGGLSRSPYSKKKLDDIISARMLDCFELIDGHLKKLGLNKLLPAGIIISGGSSRLNGIKASAENSLSLPAQIAEIHFGNSERGRIKDNSWMVCCGLVLLGLNTGGSGPLNSRGKASSGLSEGGQIFKRLGRWLSQFLP